MDGGFWFEAGALLPSIGVGLIFWFAMRAILRADRREREAERDAEKEFRAARRGGESSSSGDAAAINHVED